MAGKNKIMQAVVSFAGTIDPSLGKAMDNVAGHLDKVNWKAVAVGAAVGGIAVATGKAVVEAGKYLAELGDDYNKAMNQLSASTGATGDELDALGESVKNIYAQNLGEDFNDVAEGLAATQKASDLAGEALEQATAAGFVLRDTFDYDISESARAASALMKNFNISAEEAYGLIATGAQNGADKNGDLLDTLNEYSAQFAALGLSADQFMGSLVEGADAGLFSIDKVADAVKEFNIRRRQRQQRRSLQGPRPQLRQNVRGLCSRRRDRAGCIFRHRRGSEQARGSSQAQRDRRRTVWLAVRGSGGGHPARARGHRDRSL